jgi:23S rRNA pseudouridine1911/1915/1917 synthase
LTDVVPAALAGQRVDRVVAMLTGLSRAVAADLVDAGRVSVDGQPLTIRSARLREGAVVGVDLPEPESGALVPDAGVAVNVVHEDGDLLVIDKPAGLVVHPGAGHGRGTLVHGLLARYPELAAVGDPLRPGIVHRLDKGTSGLLVVARTPASHGALVADLQARRMGRQYTALVWGHPAHARGIVDAPVGRSGRHPTRMAVSQRGRAARTAYDVVTTYSGPAAVARLTCRLETGRTHQIRVHLAALGHPVVGDRAYGGFRDPLPLARPFLHAARLELVHPVTGETLVFDSPLPDDLTAVLASLTG